MPSSWRFNLIVLEVTLSLRANSRSDTLPSCAMTSAVQMDFLMLSRKVVIPSSHLFIWTVDIDTPRTLATSESGTAPSMDNISAVQLVVRLIEAGIASIPSFRRVFQTANLLSPRRFATTESAIVPNSANSSEVQWYFFAIAFIRQVRASDFSSRAPPHSTGRCSHGPLEYCSAAQHHLRDDSQVHGVQWGRPAPRSHQFR